MPARVNCCSPEEGNGLMRNVLERGRSVAMAVLGVRAEIAKGSSDSGRRRPMNARRLTLTVLVSLCASTGALLLSSASALAAAPEAPVTVKASGVTATSAILEGTLNPGASAKAGWYFFYSTEISCLIGQAATPQEPEVVGQALAEHVEVTGLQPSKTYRVCMVATNEVGESTPSANEVSFTTLAAPPAVEGESVSGVTASEAHLEATVNANNQEVTKCEFQYGTEASLATSTTVGCEPASLAGVYGGQGVGVSVSVLHADKTYYYRVIAENAAHEKTEGTIEHFITAPEAPEGLKAEPIASTTATLNGVLNPKGHDPGRSRYLRIFVAFGDDVRRRGILRWEFGGRYRRSGQSGTDGSAAG